MDELLKFEEWLETLDFSLWSHDKKTHDFWIGLRNTFEFDAQWFPALDRVEARENHNPPLEDEVTETSRIAHRAFCKAFDATQNNDIADFVEDDFYLLARATRLQFSDTLLDKLRLRYENERFPYGTL